MLALTYQHVVALPHSLAPKSPLLFATCRVRDSSEEGPPLRAPDDMLSARIRTQHRVYDCPVDIMSSTESLHSTRYIPFIIENFIIFNGVDPVCSILLVQRIQNVLPATQCVNYERTVFLKAVFPRRCRRRTLNATGLCEYEPNTALWLIVFKIIQSTIQVLQQIRKFCSGSSQISKQ